MCWSRFTRAAHLSDGSEETPRQPFCSSTARQPYASLTTRGWSPASNGHSPGKSTSKTCLTVSGFPASGLQDCQRLQKHFSAPFHATLCSLGPGARCLEGQPGSSHCLSFSHCWQCRGGSGQRLHPQGTPSLPVPVWVSRDRPGEEPRAGRNRHGGKAHAGRAEWVQAERGAPVRGRKQSAERTGKPPLHSQRS